MKNNRRIILPLILLVSTIYSITAQDLTIGLKGDIGFSKITNISEPIIDTYLDPVFGNYSSRIVTIDAIEKNFVLSGNLGFFVEKKIGKKSSIMLQCVFMRIRGKGLYNQLTPTINGAIQIPSNSGLGNYPIIKQPTLVIGDSTTVYRKTIDSKINLNYLAIPIVYRYQFSKFGVTGGIVPMFGLSAKVIDHQTILPINETAEVTYPLRNFRKVALGISTGLDYEISKNIRVTISYYQGLRAIRNSEIFKQASKNRQVNFGIKYALWKK